MLAKNTSFRQTDIYTPILTLDTPSPVCWCYFCISGVALCYGLAGAGWLSCLPVPSGPHWCCWFPQGFIVAVKIDNYLLDFPLNFQSSCNWWLWLLFWWAIYVISFPFNWKLSNERSTQIAQKSMDMLNSAGNVCNVSVIWGKI